MKWEAEHNEIFDSGPNNSHSGQTQACLKLIQSTELMFNPGLQACASSIIFQQLRVKWEVKHIVFLDCYKCSVPTDSYTNKKRASLLLNQSTELISRARAIWSCLSAFVVNLWETQGVTNHASLGVLHDLSTVNGR